MAFSDVSDEFYGFKPVVAFERSFDALFGLELEEGGLADGLGDGEEIRARVTVRPELLGAAGVLHGGVFAAIAEALASRGTALAVIPQGMTAQGLSNDTTMTRPIHDGIVHATARVVARNPDIWVWAIEMRDDSGSVCGFSRVTIAVRPRRAG